MKREKRKTADAPKSTPSPVQQGAAEERDLSTQDSALSTSSSVLDVFCPKCIYNLRGIDSARCPECGYSLAFLKIAESQIPWVHRKEIGRFRAYWRTVWWATFRRRKFGEELTRSVSLPDARRFHRVTVLLFCTALFLMTAFLVFAGPPSIQAGSRSHPALAVCVILVGQFCALLFLEVVVRIGTDAFRDNKIPAPRQAQAIRLSYYMAGTFAWMFLPWLPSFKAFQLAPDYEHVWYLELALVALGTVLLISPGLLWAVNLNYLERRLCRHSAAEKFKAEFRQAAFLCVAVFVVVFLLPMMIAYVALIFYSLA